MTNYTEDERRHLAEYARIAAERYREHVKTCAAHPRIAEQFARQAAEARALAARIESEGTDDDDDDETETHYAVRLHVVVGLMGKGPHPRSAIYENVIDRLEAGDERDMAAVTTL